MKRQLMMLLGVLPFVAAAQTFDFDMTKPQPVYSADAGYGYDILPAPTKKTQDEPFYFSVKVDDGNYRVKVELGSKKRVGETTVRAEGLRLLAHNVATKKGQFVTYEFVVNKRSPRIDDKSQVRIKDREKAYLAWDDKLTLEFNGDAPAVKSIHIERGQRAGGEPYRDRAGPRGSHALSLRKFYRDRPALRPLRLVGTDGNAVVWRQRGREQSCRERTDGTHLYCCRSFG